MHPTVQLIYAGLDTRSNIVRSVREVTAQGENVSLRHVLDIDVVSSLFSRAVDLRESSGDQVPGEDGHHSSFTVGILTWPIHVRVAQGRVGDTILNVVEVKIALSGELRDTVR